MSIRRTSKSGLFLLELIIIILFFSITGAVCVQLFVTASLTSRDNRALNHAMLEVQTAAECVKNAGGEEARLQQLLPVAPQPNGSLAAYYDKNWQPTTEKSEAAYTLSITKTGTEKEMLCATIAMRGGEKEIFALEVKRFLGAEEGAAA